MKRSAPAPADTTGNGVRKHGSTWWGQRWIAVLEHGSRDMVARLGKGRAYARDGHVHGLKVLPGQVQADVSDDELDSHRVMLRLEAFDDATWQHILIAMSQQAMNAAQLLNGEMPRDIDQVFRACGKTLFPADHHEIDADCSCEDWTSPCKHVAATHYVLGEALDTDPFLLFELRGRRKDEVLGELDRLRTHAASALPTASAETGAEPAYAMTLSRLNAHDFERSEATLPVLTFHFELDASASVPPATLLRSLGKPASWNIPASPQELLEPALQHARQLAMELAGGSGQVSLRAGQVTRRRR